MSPRSEPPFRTGNVLTTVFTGTLTERLGAPVEHIPTPERLDAWFAENGLAVAPCTTDDLRAAVDLREAIHRAAVAAATMEPLPRDAVEVINRASAAGVAWPCLDTDGRRVWRWPGGGSPIDALSVVAADAIDVLSGGRGGRFALCASPTCREPFLDTSQNRTRRWCDMNYCGNRHKKARFRGK